jgi:hypothetical protein
MELERELYEGVNALGAPGQMQISEVQFAIRFEEHRESALHLYERAVGLAGYSAQTFGLTGDVAVTATEVTARERKSLITRDKKIVYTRPPLTDILYALQEIDATVFKSGITPERPDLDFGDGVSEDPTELAQTAQLLRAADSASTKVLVGMVHPDWEEAQVDEEVAAIDAERQAFTNVSDPFGGMGSGGSDTPPDQPGRAAYGG